MRCKSTVTAAGWFAGRRESSVTLERRRAKEESELAAEQPLPVARHSPGRRACEPFAHLVGEPWVNSGGVAASLRDNWRSRYFITVALPGVNVTEFAPALRLTGWPQKSDCLS